MAQASLISKFTLPSLVDVTNGSVIGRFSIELAGGLNWVQPRVMITFKHIPYSFEIGGADGTTVDTFHDSTPNYAATNFELHGGYPAGTYSVDKLYIWDTAGKLQATYTEADLMAMGLPYFFGIRDDWAPTTPTLNVTNSTSGLVDGNRAVVGGTADPGAAITVYYKDANDHSSLLGKTTADAQGKWSLSSDALADGEYSDVVATATNSNGYVSNYSLSSHFFVQQPPVAQVLHVANLVNGAVGTDHPFIWGVASPNAKIALYDGANQLSVMFADEKGWWGLQTPALAAGQHQLSVHVTDRFSREAPASDPVLVQVAPATAGIHFKIDAASNVTSQGLNEGQLQALLDAVSVMVSGLLDGDQTVNLSVKVRELSGNAIASAGADVQAAVGGTLMPQMGDARLNITPGFAAAINGDGGSFTAYEIGVLAHEMLHVMGFNDDNQLFANHIQSSGTDTYFSGTYANMINGGRVLLSSDSSHVADPADMIAPAYNPDHPYFSGVNTHAPYTALDLAMLKDMGYQNTDTIVSADGHTYLPGNGKAGHNAITGIDGVDTAVFDAKASAYTIKANASGYSLTGKDGTFQLANIERIHFTDADVALDVAAHQNGGMVYRMYQAAFGRTPDSAGLGYWLPKVDGGVSVLDLAREFKNSAEFTQLYGANLNDSGFISQLYHNVLNRAPDQAGLDYWLGALSAGAARESVLLDFSESGENIARLAGVLHDGFSYTPMVA